MTTFDQLITGAALLGLAVSTIISYLKVNKLWARRHIKEVAESISVAAALLSLLTTVPFMIKFLVIDQDYVAAGKFLLSLAVFVVFFLVGIGVWVKREEKIGLWKMLRRALATERGELAYLIHSFARPREAPAILEILRLVSMVDNDFDERERELLESVALPWGIHPDDMKTTGPEAKSDISSVQRAFADYLGLKPPASQVEKVFDLVRFMVHADRKVTRDERLILTEVEGAVGAYLTDGSKSPDVFEVLLVPQNDQQFEKMREEVTDPSLQERAGGQAVVAGSYFSEPFARAICLRFRQKHFFCTVERLTSEGERFQLAG
ncbi:MAG: hypothetical protein PVI08_02485 [Gammaproteobacteria bacterium]|jgi:hypothetical protein